MKKTYKPCSVGLLVGLLSFHTLSSCVNTGRALGIAEQSNKKINSIINKKEAKTYHKLGVCMQPCPYCEDPLCSGCVDFVSSSTTKKVIGVVAVVAVTTIAGVAYYFSCGSNSTEETTANATLPSIGNATTDVVPLPVRAVGSLIGNATTVLVTALPTLGLVAALKPNGSNGNGSTQGISSDRVEDPMVLDCQIVSYFQKNPFSVEGIKYWLAKGLNIHAMDDEERDLLMVVASKRNLSVLSFLLEKTTWDPNKKDISNNTALHYFVYNSYQNKNTDDDIEKGCRLLLEKGGINPLIKNKHDKTAESYAESDRIRKLLQAAERKYKAKHKYKS